jgi:NADPH-dependent 2,4-dienoyl-CoA reductase/sulfur reductase-like enzyme
MHEGIDPLRILGNDGAEGVSFRDRAGKAREIAGDAVAIGFGLKPETQLAELAGCRFGFDAPSRQWLPMTDDQGRAEGAPGIYLAGDGAGIAGAAAAELAGERAALALLADLGRRVPAPRTQAIGRRLARIGRFRAGLEAAFPYPAALARGAVDDTILCRCEAVTVGTLRAAARDDAEEINRAKAICRVGMGRCQGRICGGPAAEVFTAARGVDLAAAGRLRAQPPVKPLPLAWL